MAVTGPLPTTSERYKFMLLIVDRFSGFPEPFPLKTQEAKESAEVLYREIICRYGAPRVLIPIEDRPF